MKEYINTNRMFIIIQILALIMFCNVYAQDSIINSINALGEKHGFWVYRTIGKNSSFNIHMGATDIYMGSYNNGIKVATWRWYNNAGFLKSTETYNNNEKHDSIFYQRQYHNNKVIAEGTVLNRYLDTVIAIENPLTGEIEDRKQQTLMEIKIKEWKYYNRKGKLKRKEYTDENNFSFR